MFALGLAVDYRCYRCGRKRAVDLEGGRRIVSGYQTLVVRVPRACLCGERRLIIRFDLTDDADPEEDDPEPGPKAG